MRINSPGLFVVIEVNLKNEAVQIIKIRCRGEDHTIILKGDKLAFPDHDMREEANFAALGGTCRCWEVLQLWRNCNTNTLPRQLRRRMPDRMNKIETRMERRVLHSSMKSGCIPFSDFKDRYTESTCAAALATLWRNNTRYSDIESVILYRVSISVGVRPCGVSYDATTHILSVNLGWLWYYDVHEMGLSQIDGYWIMAIVDRNPLRVLVHRELNKPPCLAGVVYRSNGGPTKNLDLPNRLKWL